jgi:hypothetical protein
MLLNKKKGIELTFSKFEIALNIIFYEIIVSLLLLCIVLIYEMAFHYYLHILTQAFLTLNKS